MVGVAFNPLFCLAEGKDLPVLTANNANEYNNEQYAVMNVPSEFKPGIPFVCLNFNGPLFNFEFISLQMLLRLPKDSVCNLVAEVNHS